MTSVGPGTSQASPELFGGGNSDMKAKVAQLEYELENERAHASELGGKLRAVEGELAKVKDSLDLYKGRMQGAGEGDIQAGEEERRDAAGFRHGHGSREEAD